jgi:hypothetical protein
MIRERGSMRSLHYVLGGKPANFDDCIDLADQTVPTGVELKAVVREIVSELCIYNLLSCEFLWHFPEQDICYEESFGGCFYHESEQRQMRSVDNANMRLVRRIDRLRELHIPVRVAENVFDYSNIHPKKAQK